MLFGLVVARDVLTAYMAGVVLILPWVWLRTHDPAVMVWAVFVNIIFALAMVPEIRQWVRIRREDKWNDTSRGHAALGHAARHPADGHGAWPGEEARGACATLHVGDG